MMLSELKSSYAKPFIKWAGGKKQLLPEILKNLPIEFNRYFEPFLGGGALFFKLQPPIAVINDINSEIINLYLVIKTQPELLINELKTYSNTPEFYYHIRNLDRNENYKELSEVKKAARVLYLNKTCYNGLYRVNSNGEFNVPFGFYKDPNIIDEYNLLEVSAFLNSNNINILNTDFEEAVKTAQKNDFVYFDPPYDPIKPTSSFTSYTSMGFNKSEQIRLKNLCVKLNNLGVKFLLSNSATPFILDLYKGFKITIIKAARNINSIGTKRGKINEVLIRNY